MEKTLNSHAEALAGSRLAPRTLILRFRTYQRHRQNLRYLAQLPDHLLKDIGFEALITDRKNQMPTLSNHTF